MPTSEATFDEGAWRVLLQATLAQSGLALVVCNLDLDILFADPNAGRLLQRFGPAHGTLPEAVGARVTEQLASPIPDPRRARLAVAGVRGVVYVRAARLYGVVPARIAVWLREEILRDDALYARVKQTFGLSPRAFQLVQLVRRGLSNREIAETLGLTEATVKVYLHEVYRAVSVSSRTSLIATIERIAAHQEVDHETPNLG